MGSLRKGGNTEIAIKEALRICKELGAETDLITLYDKKIYDICLDGQIEDDVLPILEKMKKADAIIIGSPVYLGDISGVLKCLLDRCLIVKKRGMLFKNKIGGCIAVGAFWGHSRTLETLVHFFCGHAMLLASVDIKPGIGIELWAREKGELKEDKKELAKVQKLVYRIFELLNYTNAVVK